MKRTAEIAVLAIIILAALALRYVNPYFLADLPIVPDSAQYATAGVNIAEGKGFCIFINNLRLPPLYPPGFPLILAAFYQLVGAELHEAIYVVLGFGLLSILLVYLFARSVYGTATALLAALLLSVAPLYTGYSQVLISDMPSKTFLILGLWLAWLAAVRERKMPLLWLVAGISCGTSATIHLLSGLTLVPLLTACALASRGKLRSFAFSALPAAIGFIIGLSPVLAYNYTAFESPFTTGYDYWARWGEPKQTFSFLFAIANTAVSESGDQKGNIIYYLWHFFGLSWPTLFAPYFPAVLFLAGVGTVAGSRGCGTRRRGSHIFTLMSLSFICTVMVVLFFYSYQMARFLLTIVPFICILAAYGIVVLLRSCRGSDPRSRLLRIPVGLLILLTAWGCWWPYSVVTRDLIEECSRSGAAGCWERFRRKGLSNRTPTRSFSREDLKTLARSGIKGYWQRFQEGISSGHAPTWWYEGLATLDKAAPPDAHLVSGIDGVYVTYYFVKDTDRRYIPISRDVEYLRQRDLPLTVAVENPERIKDLLRQGKKVYMDGFTFNWWRRYRDVLAGDFAFVPVAPYYGGKLFIYELAPLKEGRRL